MKISKCFIHADAKTLREMSKFNYFKVTMTASVAIVEFKSYEKCVNVNNVKQF